MDWATVLDGIDAALASDQGRAEKAARIATLIRQAGAYRWVGVYQVTDHEIAAVGWSGPGAPTHPRFPVTQGLSGAAVASRRAVVVGEVTADPRYLTAFSSTRSEAIVPVVAPATGAVVGTLDVESGEPDAFTDADQQALERCAAALGGLFCRGGVVGSPVHGGWSWSMGGSVVPAVLVRHGGGGSGTSATPALSPVPDLLPPAYRRTLQEGSVKSALCASRAGRPSLPWLYAISGGPNHAPSRFNLPAAATSGTPASSPSGTM